ncbi:hypothetical protein PV350_44850 [Streptomyces sp. PA03-6a]|nr:hypothetical protein [Streptomyces sp. PA03-6a]
MTKPLRTKEEACAAARAVLDRARYEITWEYETGRLAPDRVAAYERLLTDVAHALYAFSTAPTPQEGVRQARALGSGQTEMMLATNARLRAEGRLGPKTAAFLDRVAPLPGKP